MSLKGDLRTMPLPDVLQWVATGRKTGTLHVERRSVQKRILLREGAIFSSWSNDPREAVPAICVDYATLTRQNLDPHEGFVLSRVNGQWDVQSILKLCPMGEDEALLIFARLLDRKLIRLS